MVVFPPDFDFDNDPIYFNCSDTYDDLTEILKYCGHVLYLFPSIILHGILLYILVKKKEFSDNSFFKIYTFDCATSMVLLILDMFFIRLFMYIPPLCPTIGPFFFDPSITLKIVFVSVHYCRTSKSVIQIFAVINRMTCVLFPTRYHDMWHDRMKLIIFLLIVIPYGACWNITISRVYMASFNNGIAYNYYKNVQWVWASLSKFQFGYVTCAFVFTIVCTSITVYALVKLPSRVKSTERGLCFASMVISFCFLSVAIFQGFFAFCPSCIDGSLLFSMEFVTFDFLNVGSPIVIICISRQLRNHLFRRNGLNDKTITIVVSQSTRTNN